MNFKDIAVDKLMETISKFSSISSYQIRILIGSLFAAIVADGIITRFLVHNGFAQEGNPFLIYWVVEDKLLSIKILGGLLAILYLWSVYRRHPKLSISFTSVSLIGYIFILCWNFLTFL